MIYKLGSRQLQIAGDDYFVADNATVIGSVIMHQNASVWFNAVLRGDNEPIEIGANTNIQDGTVIHTDAGIPFTIGEFCTVGHQAMLHGCQIGNNTLIGINAVVLNNAKIGNNCIIGANALIPEGKIIPDNSLVMGSPGKVVKELTDHHRQAITMSALHYVENFKRYQQDLKIDERFQ
ncbi:MAG: gamma carbonic anhydrase family protein [Gammaproteobacteria bacterium]|nr:MAG: gamma carbonic anhydrase family protein [Gammaproteobacteria bacterium]